MEYGRCIYEDSGVFVGACIDQDIITRLYIIKRAAQLVDECVFIRVILGDVGLAVDIETDRFIECVIELLDCLEPVVDDVISPLLYSLATDVQRETLALDERALPDKLFPTRDSRYGQKSKA